MTTCLHGSTVTSSIDIGECHDCSLDRYLAKVEGEVDPGYPILPSDVESVYV